MEPTEKGVEMGQAIIPDVLAKLTRAQATLAQVYATRSTSAISRFAKAAEDAGHALRETRGTFTPQSPWHDANSYGIDFLQRSILYWDTLRQRGNNWIEHEKAGKPPLLAFDWEMIADARGFERPANYALVRILPPDGVAIDPTRRPFVVIDPRAGHGPGIGGFKQDSQVGVALKAGHPVYFVIFFPEPMAGQTLADVSSAEAEFLRIVRKRHPDTRKPVVIGNCQGGWAAMLVGALDPDLPGPVVINGAPMSYWAGNDGDNPMRYAGGMLGGVWPALLASDLGGGIFDGAYLVDNFEYLNPANTYFDKYYNLFKKIDSEPPRFLEFERWWGGFFLMERAEIKWIVENLFVGNRLAAGEAEWSEGRAFDLREIRSPIILFASLGDNITPPQQAFNWVVDLYPTTEALKASGQVIVGLMHKSVGHLGIFVSGQVAKKEHSQIVDLIEYIEHLPPGLYGMQIEEQQKDGKATFDVVLRERRVEELQALQKYGRKDELPFEAVEVVSDTFASTYETFVRPAVASIVPPAVAKAARLMHPQRAQRWLLSDINPFLWPLERMAELSMANRVQRSPDNPFVAAETWAATMTSAWWDLYRDLRDASVESLFFRTYLPASLFGRQDAIDTVAAFDPKRSPAIQAALARIDKGSRIDGLVRMALLLTKAGTDLRRLSAMKQARELVGREVGLVDMPAEAAQAIIRTQSYIVEYDPSGALATLPKLLTSAEDRKVALDLVDRVRGRLEANDKQRHLIETFHRLLGEGGRTAADIAHHPRSPRKSA